MSCILKHRYLRIYRVVSGLILTKVLLRNLEFKIKLYLVRQIPENTEGYTWIGNWRGSKTIYWSRACTTDLPFFASEDLTSVLSDGCRSTLCFLIVAVTWTNQIRLLGTSFQPYFPLQLNYMVESKRIEYILEWNLLKKV